MMTLKTTLFPILAGLLVSACTVFGTDSSSISGTCDRTGSGLSCATDADCEAGEECDDGVCKLHGSVCEDDGDTDTDTDGDTDTDTDGDTDTDTDGDTDGSGSGSGASCSVDANCAGGEECDDGRCKPHGG
ncbi:MAG: hypothetical protein R3B48_00130 [Kofleriaceae bacterium]